MATGPLDETLSERKLLIAVAVLLFAALCLSWLTALFPGLSSAWIPQEFNHVQPPVAGNPAATKAEPRVMPEFPLNINTADASRLQQLPGIGPVLAQRIIAFRQANGEFKDIADLIKVKGIGQKKLARLADKIILP